ncbi:MAG: iron-sulfur cluster-binding protein [Anaerolineae bacterium]|nr:iron-sulfur cluster-binding protein [Anaerolineae bacterium]
MDSHAAEFVVAARRALADTPLQAAVKRATDTAARKRDLAMFAAGRDYGEALRQQSAAARHRALSQLPDLLEQAEARLTANGATVLWAVDAAEVCQHVQTIAAQHGVRRVTKAKSMISEEVGLNDALIAAGIETLETDLGEFIIQLAGEAPSHIVTPVIHKSKEAIRDLLVERLDMPPTDDAGTMARFAREHLRAAFLSADMGISGGNFIIAETGTLCLVTNEGNGRMVTTLPPVHVALVGIEKVVATLEDYALLTQVLPRSATGQALAVYTHMINGPRRPDEIDGPEALYIILVDNGRSAIYGTDYAEVLGCIRCGACMNACPIYEATGGHAYGWVYPGPVGAVLTPLLTDLQEASPLPYASTLCGKCKEVCPVDIDLPRMLLDLRRDLVNAGHTPWLWAAGMRGWSLAARSPRLFDAAAHAARIGQRALPDGRKLPLGPLGGWTASRELPRIAAQPFRAWWAAQEKAQSHDDEP